ncbi:hypothetical protein [Vibrio maritimus]|uniref:hypothetical protein n=1 Tax=Vibrio maritimus TaxID=990268 RepID=UPI001F4759B6|nr:hypothetical protein [Vibrio maritimus]
MTEQPKKPLTTQKKILNGVMVLGIATMVGFMLYDVLFSTPSKPTHPLNEVAFEAEEQHETLPSTPVLDIALTPQTLSHGEIASLPSESVVKRELPPTQYQLVLPPDVEAALDDLKSDYFSQIKTNANHSKIAQLQSQQSLDALHAPPVPVTNTAVDSHQLDVPALVRALTLRSIVFNPIQKTAWFELSGELIPVKERAWIEEVRVYKISKTTVVLIDKNGRTYTKYMPNQATVEVVDNES